MSYKYIVLDNNSMEHELFTNKTEVEKYINERVDEFDYVGDYLEVYELGNQLTIDVKPRTVVLQDVKVPQKKTAKPKR